MDLSALVERIPRHQRPMLLLAAVAVILAAIPFVVFGGHAGETEYWHDHVGTVNCTDAAVPVDSLSDRERTAVLDAIDGGQAALYGDGVEEFTYPGLLLGTDKATVSVDGECHRLRTHSFPGWITGVLTLAGLFVGVTGLIFAGLAAVLRRPRATLPGWIAVALVVGTLVLGPFGPFAALAAAVGGWRWFELNGLAGKHGTDSDAEDGEDDEDTDGEE